MTQNPERPQQSRLHHLGLSVADLDRSTAWYSEVLGAIVIREPYAGERASFSGRMAIVSLGVLSSIFSSTPPIEASCSIPHTGLDHLGLIAKSYEQLDAWARWLDANGVRRSKIREAGGIGSIF
ncbi:MAG TPA: VOC family protein [Acidimicrobiales bacterium]|nr:VOC family protein [Acidimicrobiales bacterium]